MFLVGDDIKRVRRNISPSTSTGSISHDNSTLNHSSSFNATRNLTDTVNSSQPMLQSLKPEIMYYDLASLFRNLNVETLDLTEYVLPEKSATEISKASCPDGQVYDFYIQVCRPAISPVHFTGISNSRIFSVGVWMRPNVSSFIRPLVAKADVRKALVDKLDINATFISDVTIGNSRSSREFRTVTIMFNINLSQTNFSIHSLKTAMSSLSIIVNGTNFDVFKLAVKSFYCPVREIFKPNEYTVEGNVVTITNTGEKFQEVDYYSNETKWLNGSYVPTGVLTVCKQHTINCSGIFIGLTEDEYSISSNSSLYRNASGEFFEPGRFQLINGTVWVCVNFSSNYTEESLTNNLTKKNMVLDLLTYVGLTVSILSFILVLVTYSLFQELRTLPGINLINLFLAHLLADLVFLSTATVLPELACTIVAILLHYFFLVSFMWMSIIAFETWRTFSKIRIQHRNLNRREKCFYLLRKIALGWLPPSVFVGLCVTLDQSHKVDFHYGRRNGCWISNPTANLFSFALPVAFAISFNIVFFVLTVIAIRKTGKQARKATYHTANRKTAAVFVKIFILMGFTWIFGFLQILVSRYFSYPFVLFTSFTGLYVALAFVNTPRVRQFYRALLCKDKRGSSSLGTDNTPVIPELNNEGPTAV